MEVSIILRQGMGISDLPEAMRPAFRPPIAPEFRPSFRFRSGRFYKLIYGEWEVYEAHLPWGSLVCLNTTTWGMEGPPGVLTADSQIRAATVALLPHRYGFDTKYASSMVRRLVWC